MKGIGLLGYEFVQNKTRNALRRTNLLIDQRHDSGKGRRGNGCSAISGEIVYVAVTVSQVALTNQIETAKKAIAGKERNVWKITPAVVRNSAPTLPRGLCLSLSAAA